MNLKPARWLATAIVEIGLLTGNSNAADNLDPSIAAAKARTTGTTVLSLDGKDWVVAADPNNSGRSEVWRKAARPDAKPVRVPGIFQERGCA